MKAQKSRFAEFSETQSQHQARLLDIEQRVYRRGGGDAGGGGAPRFGAFSASADNLLAGLSGTNVSRVSLPIPMAALSDVNHELSSQNLGAISVYTPSLARLIDLLPARAVEANTVSYLRVDFATDSPPGNRADVVAELAPKPESSVAVVPVNVEVKTFAHWCEASRQILDDVAELKTILDVALRGGLLDVIDGHIFGVMTSFGNYSSFSPVGGEEVADGVARISAKVVAAGGTGVVVCLHPDDYLSMALTKQSTAGGYFGLPPNGLAARVIACPAITQTKVLAFAPGSGAGWLDREAINLTMGLQHAQFSRNAISLLVEGRGEVPIRNVRHVCYGDLQAGE